MKGGGPTSKQGGRAISPVVGVILLVCLCLLLSTVAATYLFGFTAEEESPKPMASVDIEQQDIGPDFQIVRVTLTESRNTEFLKIEPTSDSVCVRNKRIEEIGRTATIGCSKGDTLTIVAHSEAGQTLVKRYQI